MKAVQTVDIPIGTGASSVTINLQANKWNRTDSGIIGIVMQCTVLLRVRSVNSKSFIFVSEFVFFSEEKMNSESNMKLLLFSERTLHHILYVLHTTNTRWSIGFILKPETSSLL